MSPNLYCGLSADSPAPAIGADWTRYINWAHLCCNFRRHFYVSFKPLDSFLLVLTVIYCIYNCSRKKSSEILCCEIHWDFDPFEFSTKCHGQSDGRVQVTARNTSRDENSQHDSDAKSPINAEKIAICIFAQYNLSNTGISKNLESKKMVCTQILQNSKG
jgi:hypothetical protein